MDKRKEDDHAGGNDPAAYGCRPVRTECSSPGKPAGRRLVSAAGLCRRPEPGSTVLTADLGGGPLALGVPMAQADLLPGEIRLTAGAAILRLCPDGRVYLNGVEITPAGTAEKGGQSHGSDAS